MANDYSRTVDEIAATITTGFEPTEKGFFSRAADALAYGGVGSVVSAAQQTVKGVADLVNFAWSPIGEPILESVRSTTPKDWLT